MDPLCSTPGVLDYILVFDSFSLSLLLSFTLLLSLYLILPCSHSRSLSLLLSGVLVASEFLLCLKEAIVCISGRENAVYEGGVPCALLPLPPEPHPSWTLLPQVPR